MCSLHSVHSVTNSNNKAKNNNLKNTKKLYTEIILRCTPCRFKVKFGNIFTRRVHYDNTSMRYMEFFITAVKMVNCNSFLIFAQNIDCEYTLESSH